ncbi:MAG: HEAT repeat domain-containing protein [Elusimicrobia bacterium]|nr:HEAT repeat domain-containing protein [Elusimicrobiota bacterium]
MLNPVTLLPLCASLSWAGADMFPPVERILSGIHPPRPGVVAVEKDLRDSLAPARSMLWLQAELRSSDWERRRQVVSDQAFPMNKAAVPYVGAVLLNLNEDPRVRVAAAMTLGRIGDRAGGRFLKEALDDPEVDVRFAVALALGSGYEGVVTPLSETLAKDPSWWVRYAAAVSLGNLGKPFAVGALASAAVADSSWQVRLQAARSLGTIHSPRSAQALSAVLRDADPGVRAAAAMALGETGGEAAIDRLKDALEDEIDPFQRSLLVASLKKALEN